MKIILAFVLIIISMSAGAQILIRGTVKDENNIPLTGANIYLKGTYTGATSDTNGYFSFSTSLMDTCILVVRFIGYETVEKSIVPDKKVISVDFHLKELQNELDMAVIIAGTFEAGDKKKSVLLSALDIVTTANAEGDIYGALNMLPGAQTEGETGKIIVRGGESGEMKTFMDGMLISSPYTSRMPDIPARGRFSPFLFNGVLFSTGGYSAEYGQALSSVLELHTDALAEETVTSISLLNVGAGLGHTHRFDKSSFTLETDYSNLAPYFAMTKHNLDWEKVPESISGQFRFRKKTGEEGMIKSFLSYSNSNSVLNYNNFSTNTKDRIGMEEENLFQSTTFNTKLGEKWLMKTGIAFNLTEENYAINQNRLKDILRTAHARISFNNFLNKNLTLKFGIENFLMENKKKYSDYNLSAVFAQHYNDYLLAGFTETDIRINKKTALRFGVRAEYSGYIRQANFAPRLSLAYQISKDNQLSLAYGKFFQQANNEFMLYTDSLKFENASHYIFNYQYSKNNRLFRIEAYHKQYDNLMKYTSAENFFYTNLSNRGSGYAQGLDIFWRDKKTFRAADYWISYSFIKTEREYRDYPVRATPVFASKHNLSVVFKYWLSALNSQVGATYKYRSGRPYYNPNNPEFLSDRTKSFNDVSVNFSYLTSLFGHFTIVYLACGNVLGFKNIFGYHYETSPDESGIFQSHAIQPYAKRTFIAAIFISIK